MSAVSLADLKRYLNITSTTNDDELQQNLDAAEHIIARRLDLSSLEPGVPVAVTVNGVTTYTTTGLTAVPADLAMAVKELARHLWTSQRGPTARPGAAPDGSPAPGYLLPNRVREILAAYELPGIA